MHHHGDDEILTVSFASSSVTFNRCTINAGILFNRCNFDARSSLTVTDSTGQVSGDPVFNFDIVGLVKRGGARLRAQQFQMQRRSGAVYRRHRRRRDGDVGQFNHVCPTLQHCRGAFQRIIDAAFAFSGAATRTRLALHNNDFTGSGLTLASPNAVELNMTDTMMNTPPSRNSPL